MPSSNIGETYIKGARLAYDQAVIFNNIDMKLVTGGWTCLLGQSGVGKSSLLRLIAGLENEATASELVFAGESKPDGKITYMAQQDLLMPWLTLAENVSIGSRLRGNFSPENLSLAHDLLERVGLGKETQFFPSACSGGMRQRAALARTLFEDRQIVLMDEPFSSVDAITRIGLQDLAAEILSGKTILLVTHDPQEALRMGDQILVMRGNPAKIEILTNMPTGKRPRELDGAGMALGRAEILEKIRG